MTSVWFFPYAGGGGASYWEIRQRLSSAVLTRVVPLPGRDGRFGEKYFYSFDDLVDDAFRHLLADFRKARAPNNVLFYGHSMGALLAAIVAERIENEYPGSVAALVVSGSPAPQIAAEGMDEGWRLADREFLGRIARAGLVPPDVLSNPELSELFLPVWRADYRAVSTFVPEIVRLNCPVHVLVGHQDQLVPPEYMDSWKETASEVVWWDLPDGGHGLVKSHPDTVAALVHDVLGGPHQAHARNPHVVRRQ